MASQYETSGKPRKKRLSWFFKLLTFFMVVLALYFSVMARFSSKNESIKSINRVITDTIVPEMKRSGSSDTMRAVYDLKHILLTLDRIKESSKNEEIKTMVEQLKKQIEELSVKIFVHE